MIDQTSPAATDAPDYAALRQAMVANQLRTTAVNDPRVVAAMREVPRERFVPVGWERLAYADRTIPLGHGRAMADPMVLGRLLTEARLRGDERALVIGGATGYAAAVLRALVAHVVALEDPEGPDDMGSGAQVVGGPLEDGWAAGAPYDLILIDGAIEAVPDALVAQLADGGRLAAAIVDRGVARLSIGTKGGAGFGLFAFAEADVPALPGFTRPRVFTF